MIHGPGLEELDIIEPDDSGSDRPNELNEEANMARTQVTALSPDADEGRRTATKRSANRVSRARITFPKRDVMVAPRKS